MSGVLESAREVLGQGVTLMGSLDDAAYASRLPAAFDASIGGHMRHCLDHFRSLLDGLDADEINYDARPRDPRIETLRPVALEVARQQLREFGTLDRSVLVRPVRVRAKVSYRGEESPVCESTVGREIMFCVIHAIHHYALCGVMCGMLNVPLPAGFGVAPATLKHHRDQLAA